MTENDKSLPNTTSEDNISTVPVLSGNNPFGDGTNSSSSALTVSNVASSQEETVGESKRVEPCLVDQKSIKEPDFICFSPEAHMNFESWKAYFDAVCIENKKDDVWKIRNVQRFLKDKALTLYINNCLQVLHWAEFVELFTEHFCRPETLSLTDFSNVRFKFGEDLNDYYQRKTKIGRQLGLELRFILDGLTEGLPLEIKKLVVTNTPKNTTEWRELVFKLVKLQFPGKINEKPETAPQTPQFRQWRPQRNNFNYDQSTSMRPWNYRVPYQAPRFAYQAPQNRPLMSNQPRNPPVNVRPISTFSPRPNVHHHQATLPPTPCRICLNAGIPHVYHWMRECPFRTQNVNNQTINTPPPQVVQNATSKNEFSTNTTSNQ